MLLLSMLFVLGSHGFAYVSSVFRDIESTVKLVSVMKPSLITVLRVVMMDRVNVLLVIVTTAFTVASPDATPTAIPTYPLLIHLMHDPLTPMPVQAGEERSYQVGYTMLKHMSTLSTSQSYFKAQLSKFNTIRI